MKDISNKKSGVYQIRNKINNKLYIGSSVNIQKRFRCHKTDLNKGRHHNRYLQRAWNKYKEDSFEFIILEFVNNKDELLKMEQKYMDELRSYEGDIGYNNSKKAGNCLGVKHTDETKKKMSISSTGFKHTEETKEKISKAHKGKVPKPFSLEHRIKIGQKSKGRKVSDETKKNISEKQKGELNHASKLLESQVLEIIYLIENTEITQSEIAKIYNVTFQTISSIKRKKIWSHISLYEDFQISESLQKLIKNIKSKRNKLSIKDVKEIKTLLENTDMKLIEIANIYNVHYVAISNIKRRRTWKNVAI